MVLEGAMVVIASLCLIIMHPGRGFGRRLGEKAIGISGCGESRKGLE